MKPNFSPKSSLLNITRTLEFVCICFTVDLLIYPKIVLADDQYLFPPPDVTPVCFVVYQDGRRENLTSMCRPPATPQTASDAAFAEAQQSDQERQIVSNYVAEKICEGKKRQLTDQGAYEFALKALRNETKLLGGRRLSDQAFARVQQTIPDIVQIARKTCPEVY